MHQQPRLTLWARNDLPPKWDGRLPWAAALGRVDG